MTGKMKNISEPKPKEVVIGEKKKKKSTFLNQKVVKYLLINAA